MKKLLSFRSSCSAFLAGAILCAVGIPAAQADTLITFSVDMGTNIANGTFTPGVNTVNVQGTFNSWASFLPLAQVGSSSVYTNTYDDTVEANGTSTKYQFVISPGTYEVSADYNLRAAVLPATSGASLILPTPFFNDAGQPHVTNNVTFQVDMSQQVQLGNCTNGSSVVDVRGNFNGWAATVGNLTWDPSILETNQNNLVTSNVYVGTFQIDRSPNAAMDYKFYLNNNAENNPVLADNGGNRFFSMPNAATTLPVVFYSDSPYAPIVSNINFSVDMTIVALTDTNFNPASVTVNGDLMGWGGVAMTNDPSAANTNIYTSIQTYSDGLGASVNYQFRYTHLSDGSTIYDHFNGANGGNNNRLFIVPNVTSTNVLSVFNDASLSDYLLQPTPVFFSVDMTAATTNNLYVGTNNVGMFNPSSDNVYINGQFANWYAWSGGSTPATAPPGYQMFEQGLGLIYTNTIVIPAGTPVAFDYKYGTDPFASLGGPADDEAGFGQNHYRVVRSTATGSYSMPQDSFGTMYGEPYFSSVNTAGGRLEVGPAVGGSVPVSWLGRPGARLQVRSDLTSGAWLTLPATDGTNWTSGYSSTNGFVSQTNWPAAGNTFFRLAKP